MLLVRLNLPLLLGLAPAVDIAASVWTKSNKGNGSAIIGLGDVSYLRDSDVLLRVAIQSSIVGSAGMESRGWSWEMLGWVSPGAGWSGLSGQGFSRCFSDLGALETLNSDSIESSGGGDLTEGMP